MEEADALSDEIAILSGGKLRALGSSLFLKNRYGVGFNIALMCDETAMDQVDQMVRTKLPGAEQMANAAGYLVFSVPRRALHLIPNFFEHVENEAATTPAGQTPTVYEWGISNANLEEVFLRLAVKSTGLNAKIGGFDELAEAVDNTLIPQASEEDFPKVEVKNVETGEVLGALEPITLFSAAGEKMKISEQLYRILGPLAEEQKQEGRQVEFSLPTAATVASVPAVSATMPAAAIGTPADAAITAAPVPTAVPATVMEVASSNQRYIAMQGAVGTSGNNCQQFTAFFCKDFRLLLHRPKVMCCKLCCLIFFALLLVMFSLLFVGVNPVHSRYEKTKNICRFGTSIERSSRNGETGEFSMLSATQRPREIDLCNRTEFVEYVEHKCDWVPSLCSLNQKAWVRSAGERPMPPVGPIADINGESFSVFDSDKSGAVSNEELLMMLNQALPYYSLGVEAFVDKHVATWDANKNGINATEFQTVATDIRASLVPTYRNVTTYYAEWWNTTLLPALTTFQVNSDGSTVSGQGSPPQHLIATQSKKLLDIWLTTGNGVELTTWNRTSLFDFHSSGDLNLNRTSSNNDLWRYMFDRSSYPWMGLNVTTKSTGASRSKIPDLLRKGQNALRYSDQHGSWRQITCSLEDWWFEHILNDRNGNDVRFNSVECTDIDHLRGSGYFEGSDGDGKTMSPQTKYWTQDSLDETCPAKQDYVEKFPEVAVHVETAKGPTVENENQVEYDFTLFAPLEAERSWVNLQWFWIWYCHAGYEDPLISKTNDKSTSKTETPNDGGYGYGYGDYSDGYHDGLCEMLRPSVQAPGSWNLLWQEQNEIRSRVFEKPYMAMNMVMMNGLLKALDANGDLPPPGTSRTAKKPASGSAQLNIKVTSLPFLEPKNMLRQELLLSINLLLTPLAVMLGFPTLISSIVVEQKTRLLLMIKIQGGKLVAYWAATYLFHFTVYLCFALVYMGSMYITGIEMFVNTDFVMLFFLFVFWGHSVVSCECE